MTSRAIVDPAEMLAVDVTRLLWRRWAGVRATGIDRVCLAYLEHYRDRAYCVIQHRLVRRILGGWASRTLTAALLDPAGARLPERRKLMGMMLAHAVPGRSVGPVHYLNVGHTGLNQPGLGAWVDRYRLRPVYFVHDLIPITHPQHCRSGEALRHAERMTAALRSAHGFIVNSRDTADSLAEFAGARGLSVAPICVAPLGVPNLVAAPAQATVEPYFVVVGTIEGRKNIDLLLDVWTALADRGGAVPKLHIVGRRGWECETVCHRLDTDTRLRPHIVEHSGLTDRALATLLAQARALLFPSFVEGFGLPLFEALSLGTPAIVSDLAVFREFSGDVPDYLAPDDLAGWGAAVDAYTNDPSPRRSEQLHRLAQFVVPRWSDHFDIVDRWLVKIDS